jgi:hypothetical protein
VRPTFATIAPLSRRCDWFGDEGLFRVEPERAGRGIGFAHKQARRSVPTRRPILVVGQGAPGVRRLALSGCSTVGLASGFA